MADGFEGLRRSEVDGRGRRGRGGGEGWRMGRGRERVSKVCCISRPHEARGRRHVDDQTVIVEGD
jgi:hypothetical protein